MSGGVSELSDGLSEVRKSVKETNVLITLVNIFGDLVSQIVVDLMLGSSLDSCRVGSWIGLVSKIGFQN